MTYTHVASFGSLCHTAELLKRNKIKLCSYPFDWVFTNHDDIAHCIGDNFKTFLDKSNYTSISKTQCSHSKYHARFFNHHNPKINEAHYAYFCRCVDRFQIMLQTPEKKLFVKIFVNVLDVAENKNQMIQFNAELKKHTSNYTLLVILNTPNGKQSHAFTEIENIHFLELSTFSKSNGLNFDNKKDDIMLDAIFNSRYKFKKPFQHSST